MNDLVHVSLEVVFSPLALASFQETKDALLEKGLHLVLGEFAVSGGLSCLFELPSNEDGFVESQLLCCPLEHLSLVSVASDQSVHLHFTLLTDTVCPCYGLDVVLRVPVRIIDDDHVGAGEVDADTSCLG